jgi:hypothetical protein
MRRDATNAGKHEVERKGPAPCRDGRWPRGGRPRTVVALPAGRAAGVRCSPLSLAAGCADAVAYLGRVFGVSRTSSYMLLGSAMGQADRRPAVGDRHSSRFAALGLAAAAPDLASEMPSPTRHLDFSGPHINIHTVYILVGCRVRS